MSTADQLTEALDYVANQTTHRFRPFVDRGDVYGELAVYAFGAGQKLVERALAADGDKHRLYLALFGVARVFAEQEKAAASGYDYSDIAWYSDGTLRDLLPLALDETWDGLVGEQSAAGGRSTVSPREGGTLLAMICDVRRALARLPSADYVLRRQIDGDAFDEAVLQLQEFLGGEAPGAPGFTRRRRRVLSNEQALALTRKDAA